MKVYFENASALADGLAILSADLGIQIAEKKDSDLTVRFFSSDRVTAQVEYEKKAAKITYGGGISRAFRALAYLVDAIKRGEEKYTLSSSPMFKTNGAMVDMSRNVVMNVKTVKLMLRKMALMGQNMFMLYTEDTYEIEGRPYFGHMRGRYTKAEMKELDAYAQ